MVWKWLTFEPIKNLSGIKCTFLKWKWSKTQWIYFFSLYFVSTSNHRNIPPNFLFQVVFFFAKEKEMKNKSFIRIWSNVHTHSVDYLGKFYLFIFLFAVLNWSRCERFFFVWFFLLFFSCFFFYLSRVWILLIFLRIMCVWWTCWWQMDQFVFFFLLRINFAFLLLFLFFFFSSFK